MKRNILLWLFYLIELIFIVLCGLPSTKGMLQNSAPYILDMWKGYKNFLDKILELVRLDQLTASLSHGIRLIISAVIFNLVVLIVYQLVAFIISRIYRRVHKKKLIKNGLNTYSLSEEEKAKFEWKLYVKKFSWKGLLSFLIPLLFVALFVLIRFDKDICLRDKYHSGFFTIYSGHIEPFIKQLSIDLYRFFRFCSKEYIDFVGAVTSFLGNQSWVGYVSDVLVILIVFIIWWFFVYLFTRIFCRHSAKKRAKRAKAKYIAKMENEELKARKGSEKRISSKAEDILGDMDDTPMHDEDISTIAHVDKDSGVPIRVSEKEAEYIDDISTGVVDLGVVANDDEKELISERIPIFVGDEEIDIKLENEQVLDVVEDYDDEEVEEVEDPFFEKYRPEAIDTSYLDESLLNTQIEVYEDVEENIDDEKFAGIEEFSDKSEEVEVKTSEDTSDEVKKEEIVEPKEDVFIEEEKEEEVPVVEEVVEETPLEEVIEETPIEETPVEEVKDETLTEEVVEENKEEEIPTEELVEEEKVEEPLQEEVKEEEVPVVEETKEEAPIEEVKDETPGEEVVEENTPTEEIKEEVPVVEEVVEETPFEEDVEEEVVEKKKITPIVIKKKEEVKVEEVKKDIKPVTPIRRASDGKKKPKVIGPISVNRKYNEENRFKNARSKYLDVIRLKEEEKRKQEEEKKRQLVRRKKQNENMD